MGGRKAPARKASRPRLVPAEQHLREAPKSTHISPRLLLLDPQNPRLAEFNPGENQDDLLKLLWQHGALEEIALSISENGYFGEEPLLGVEEGGRVVIVEGNRRLATVKLLLDADLRTRLRATSLPEVKPQILEQLSNLPVAVYPNRRDLWAYLGIRHVNGPMAWDSWSKAHYIARVRNDYGISLTHIAASIGDKHQTVSRLYRGLMVLQQAEKESGWASTDRVKTDLHFSHLYTGLPYKGFQDFLRIAKVEPEAERPVPKSALPQLRELMTWLYGSKSEKKDPVVQSQNPDLKRLDDVLQNERALDALRSGLPLSVAYQYSYGDERRLRQSLTKARYELQQARGLVLDGYRGQSDLFDMAESIQKMANDLCRSMGEQSHKDTSRERRS